MSEAAVNDVLATGGRGEGLSGRKSAVVSFLPPQQTPNTNYGFLQSSRAFCDPPSHLPAQIADYNRKSSSAEFHLQVHQVSQSLPSPPSYI